jgi:hypothetical protein
VPPHPAATGTMVRGFARSQQQQVPAAGTPRPQQQQALVVRG